MEFRDLKQQYLQHKVEIDTAIQSVLMEAGFIHGRQVIQLEEELAQYVGVKHCITCANGTDALQLALMAWGVGEGDAVFVPDFTFFSSGEVVPIVGATPVFVDINPGTYNISSESLEKAIQYVLEETSLTPRVVIAVDLFGQPADFGKIKLIADKHKLLILEDAAQGFGGKIGEKKACSFGDIATTSFFPAKPLGCYGDGGALFTDNDEWAELMRSYCVHGKGTDKYDNVRIGMNSRLDTLQAAILLEKLKFFDNEIEQCNRIAMEYTRRLQYLPNIPIIEDDVSSSWAQYTICLKNSAERERIADALRKSKIPTAVYYKKPLHLQEAFEVYQVKQLECLITERVCSCCLSLPMHAYMDMADVQYITERLSEEYSKL